MTQLRRRQKESIIRETLKRVTTAGGGGGGAGAGVSSYNGRTGAVLPVIGDIVAHASTHNAGGSDAMAIDAVGVGSLRTLGVGANQATAGNDSRLSDARTPTAHTHPESDVVGLVADLAARVLTSDSRLSDARIGKGAYDPGTITLATDQYLLQDRHLYLTGAERLSATGTAEVLLTDMGNTAGNCIGTPKTPNLSFTVMTDYFLDVIKRLNLVSQIRATLQGTADLILTDDFQTRSRLVLAGMG